MKIFLSWSGPRSRAIAEALNDWLQRVIQAVKPFYSPEIEKGAKWSGEIDSALEGTSFGIVCLTADNLQSPWIHFEAGALSKTKDALIWTYLSGLSPGDVPPPLGKFQHTVAQKSDTLLLLKTINRRLGESGGESLSDRLLEENFEMFWPKLEEKLMLAEKLSGEPSARKAGSRIETPRAERAILNEILELVRSQERRLGEFEDRVNFERGEKDLIGPHFFESVEMKIRFGPAEDAENGMTKVIEFLNSKSGVTASKVLSRTGSVVVATFKPPISDNVLDSLLEHIQFRLGYLVSSWNGKFAQRE